jgi:hypothetical protein
VTKSLPGLRGKDLDFAYSATATLLAIPEDELRARYGHLNPGQQRMNLGNRLRAHYKRLAKQEAA